MKTKSTLQTLAWAAGILLTAQSLWAVEVEAGFRSLFNGTDLTGWNGNPALWSVKDGAITGITTADPKLTHNTFLVWTEGTTGDFELRLSYRIVNGNSGIQYRSKVMEQGAFGPIVGGYQADFEAGKTYSGILYEERGRGILALRGEKVVLKADPADPKKLRKEVVGSLGKSEDIQAKIKNEDWNDYVIIAQDNHLQHFINGVQTVDVTDEHEAAAAKSGVLALQIHVGPPMTVQFKDIRIKELSGGAAGNDLDRWQGTWTPTKMVRNGEPVPAEYFSKAKLVIKGNRFSFESDEPIEGTLKLDSAATPRAFDATTAGGDQALGIYELGDGTLTVCYAPEDAGRPKNLRADADSGAVLAVFRKAGGNDLDGWQGTWTPTKMVWNGEPVPAETLAKVKLVIAGNRYTLESDQPSEGTFKLDSSTSPRALDATTSGGDQVRGIYELGDGTLTFCDALGDGPRPKAFKSDPDSGTFLAVFRKAGGNDLERAQGRWTPTKMVRDGESVPAGDLAQAKLTIEGNRFSFEGDPPAEGTFKFDSSATPHTVDATASGGEQVRGIYEIKDDTFTLCYGIEDAPRPKVFKAEADSGHVLAVFRKAGGNDLERVQGRWTPTKMIRNGESVPAGDLAQIKLTIEGNQFKLDADEAAEGTFKLDSAATPRTIDATASGGEQVRGIYQLSDGTFTICYGVEDTPRPKAFKADADSGQVLAVFRKATP